MNTGTPVPKLLLLIITAMLILAVTALLVINRANVSRSRIPVLGELPDFEFTERSGKPFGLAEMKGRLNVVDFFFSSCPTVCPHMSENFRKLYELYQGSDKVRLVSITVDPSRDTLEALQEYAEKHGVTDDRWVFLRAPMEDVVRLSEEGFMLAADIDKLPMGHTTRFILVDRDGFIRSYHDGLDDASINALKQNIRQLAKAMQ